MSEQQHGYDSDTQKKAELIAQMLYISEKTQEVWNSILLDERKNCAAKIF
jgi:hypothetical protein